VKNFTSIKKIDKELERYLGKKPELEKVIKLYKEIFNIQESARQKAKPALEVSLDEAFKKLKSGKYILEGMAPVIDAELFIETAKAMGKAFAGVSGEPFPVEQLLSLPEFQPEAVDKLATKVIVDDIAFLKKFAEESSYNVETISLFIFSLLVPFFQKEAEKYQEVFEKAKWQKGHCPFCSSQPQYSRFDKEDGRRLLFCPLCRSQWRFPRMVCPFCYNSEHTSLKHFYIEEDSAHRADVCDKCKRYLKTTNERAADKEVVPQVENMVTIALDYLADKEGFK